MLLSRARLSLFFPPSPYLLALVESLAAVLLEILVSFFLGCACSRSCSGGTVSLCSISELPPLVLGLSSGLCTSLDIMGPIKKKIKRKARNVTPQPAIFHYRRQ